MLTATSFGSAPRAWPTNGESTQASLRPARFSSLHTTSQKSSGCLERGCLNNDGGTYTDRVAESLAPRSGCRHALPAQLPSHTGSWMVANWLSPQASDCSAPQELPLLQCVSTYQAHSQAKSPPYAASRRSHLTGSTAICKASTCGPLSGHTAANAVDVLGH